MNSSVERRLINKKLNFVSMKDLRATAVSFVFKEQIYTVPLNKWAAIELSNRRLINLISLENFENLRNYFDPQSSVIQLDHSQLLTIPQEIFHSHISSLQSGKLAIQSTLFPLVCFAFNLLRDPFFYKFYIFRRIATFVRALDLDIIGFIKYKWGTVVVRRWNSSWLSQYSHLGDDSAIHWYNINKSINSLSIHLKGRFKFYKILIRLINSLAGHLRKTDALMTPILNIFHQIKMRSWKLKIPLYYLRSKTWMVKLPIYFIRSRLWWVSMAFHRMKYFWGTRIVRNVYRLRINHLYQFFIFPHRYAFWWALLRYSGMLKIYYFTQFQIQKRIRKRGY